MNTETVVLRRSQRETPGLSSPEAEIAGSSSERGSSEADENARARRRPMPRKGHTKSRRGCLNCKRRKVKCQETLPGCINCQRLGLLCEYPGSGGSSLIPAPSQPLQSTGGQFSMQDLQFFQHFLFHAYPPLPLGGDAVWKEVASLSHHFDFLVHAMLGLAASHLGLGSGVNYKQQALTHRISAIESLNQALSRPCASKAEADALFATVMALAFQSSYMADGMLEFLSMIRGCMVVANPQMRGQSGTLFQQFSSETHMACVQSLNLHSLVQDQNEGFFESARSSIKVLQPLCQSTLEVKFLACLDRVLKASKTSLVDGFLEASWGYNLVGEATAADFNLFINPENYTAQIIMIHFFIVEYVGALAALRPIMHSFPFRRTIVVSWIQGLAKNLPEGLQQYLNWPLAWAYSTGDGLLLLEALNGSSASNTGVSIGML